MLRLFLLSFFMFYSTILTAGLRPTASAIDLVIGRIGSGSASAGGLAIRTSGAQRVASSNVNSKLQAIKDRSSGMLNDPSKNPFNQPYGSKAHVSGGAVDISGDQLASAIALSVASDGLKSVPVAVKSTITPAAVAAAVVGALNPLSKVALAVGAAVAIKDLLDSAGIKPDPLSPSGLSDLGSDGYVYSGSGGDCPSQSSFSAVLSCYKSSYPSLSSVDFTTEYVSPSSVIFRHPNGSGLTASRSGSGIPVSSSPLSVPQAMSKIQAVPLPSSKIEPIVKSLDSADPTGESLPEGTEPTLKVPSPSAPAGSPESQLHPDSDLIFNPDGSISWEGSPQTSFNPDGSTKTEQKTQTLTQTSPTELVQTESTKTTLKDALGNPIGSPTVTGTPAPTPYVPPASQSGTSDLCATNPGIIACEKPVDSTPPVPPKDTDLYDPFLKSPIIMPLWDALDFLPELPSPSCSYEVHKSFSVFGSGSRSFDLAPCAPLEPLRAVLQWVFGVLSGWLCFRIFFKTTS